MQVKSEPIDIPKNELVKEKKSIGASPSKGWSWPWGKPKTNEINTTPENVKNEVTDANILHHIAVAENKQRLEKEIENEGCEQDTDEQESDEYSSDFDDKDGEYRNYTTFYEKLEEYGEEAGVLLCEFKRSVEVDLNNVYRDVVQAPQQVKLLFGAGLSVYLDIFPQAAIVFLTITTVNGIIENEVENRVRNRMAQTIFVKDVGVSTITLDDVDSGSEKCTDCDEKKCV
jgi:hypothetical protein